MSSCFLLAWVMFGSAVPLEESLDAGDLAAVMRQCLMLMTVVVAVDAFAETWMHGRDLQLHPCRTFGLNLGTLLGFVVFLTMRDDATYWRFYRGPCVSLSDLLCFTGGFAFFLVGWIAVTPANEIPSDAAHGGIANVWRSLKTVWTDNCLHRLAWLLLLGRLPFIAFEFLIPLKILQKEIGRASCRERV